MKKKIRMMIIISILIIIELTTKVLAYSNKDTIKLNGTIIDSLSTLDDELQEEKSIEDYFEKSIDSLKGKNVGYLDNYSGAPITTRVICWHTNYYDKNGTAKKYYKIEHVIDIDPEEGIRIDGKLKENSLSDGENVLKWYRAFQIASLDRNNTFTYTRDAFVSKVSHDIMKKDKYSELKGSSFYSGSRSTGYYGKLERYEEKAKKDYKNYKLRFLVLDNGGGAQPYLAAQSMKIKKGNLEIEKLDKNDSSKTLKGAKFKIKDDSNKYVKFTKTSEGNYQAKLNGTITELETNSSGKIIVKDLRIGSYTLEETKAPTGYHFESSLNIKVKIEDNNTVKKTIYNVRNTGKLLIVKQSNKTNKKIPNVEFKLINSTNNDEMLFNKTGDGKYIYVSKSEWKGDKLVTGTTGQINADNVPIGDYLLQEISAPENYVVSSEKIKVTINPSQSSPDMYLINNDEKGILWLEKQDKNDSNKKLTGAKFQIKTENKKILAQKINEGEYKYLGTNYEGTDFITNEEGYIKVENLPIDKEYVIEEIEAPKDYAIASNSETVRVTANFDNKRNPLIFKNELLSGKLEIIKYDSEDNSKTLSKAEFKIKDSDGKYLKANVKTIVYATKVMGKIMYQNKYEYTYLGTTSDESESTTFVTDMNGKIELGGLPMGKYTAIETKAPKGYKIVSSSNNVTVTADKTAIVPIYNNSENGKLKIKKEDTSGKSQVKGIGFKIYQEENGWLKINENTGKFTSYTTFENATTIKTDDTGYTMQIEKIPYGKCTIYETEIPDEYKDIYSLSEIYVPRKTDNTDKVKTKAKLIETISILDDSVKISKAKNTPLYGKLKIAKIDTSGKAQVANIGFKIYLEDKGWIKVNDNGKFEKYTYFNDATEINTNNAGETIEILELPYGEYAIYETSIPSKYSEIYSLPETSDLNMFDENMATGSANAKFIETKEIKSSDTAIVEASNTPLYGKLQINKVDTSGKNQVDGIGFKVYKETKGWLKLDGEGKFIEYTSFNDATQLLTDDSGKTKTITELPYGQCIIYETFIPDKYKEIYSLPLTENLPRFNSLAYGDKGTAKVKKVKKQSIKSEEIVLVQASNTPIYGKLRIKKVETNGSNQVEDIGFKVYKKGKGWLKLNDNGQFTNYTYFKDATELKTNITGLTETIKELPYGTYRIYETSIPNAYKEIYRLPNASIPMFESLDATSVGQGNIKFIKYQDITNAKEVIVIAQNTPLNGNLKIKKIDTSGKNQVEGIGFKVYKEGKGWLKLDDNKSFKEYSSFNNATIITTNNVGETLEITHLSYGKYTIYETLIPENFQTIYSLPELENIPMFNTLEVTSTGTTNAIKFKTININKNETFTTEAENTPAHKGNLIIRKINTAGEGKVDNIGFKVYKENEGWIKLDETANTMECVLDFSNATEFKTGKTGYTKTLNELTDGKYIVYETSIPTLYKDYYPALEDIEVPSNNTNITVKGKKISEKQIDENTTDTIKVIAENTPIYRKNLIINKVNTAGEGNVSDIGFKIYKKDEGWLVINSNGEVIQFAKEFSKATELTTDSSGKTIEVNELDKGIYTVYETSIPNKYKDYYSALENIEVPNNNTTISTTSKKIGDYTLDENTTEETVKVTAQNTPLYKRKIIIRKINTDGEGKTNNIGFKIYKEGKGWLEIDNQGKTISCEKDFASATEIKTDDTGYTKEIENLDKGTYTVYETSIPDEYKNYYPALENIEIPNNNGTIMAQSKLIGNYTLDENTTEETIEVTASNTPIYKRNIIIRKVNTAGEGKIDNIGFKIYKDGNGWLEIDNQGKVLSCEKDFASATEIKTDDTGYTKEITELDKGTYIVYETSIPEAYINYYPALGNVIITTNGQNKTIKAKKVGTYTLNDNTTKETINVEAQNTPEKKKIILSGYAREIGLIQGKTNSISNNLNDNVNQKVSGINVYLEDISGKVIKKTTTDVNGNYKFTNVEVDKLKDYYIEFEYNGLLYQSLSVENMEDLSKTSTNKCYEYTTRRKTFNSEYTTINKNKTSTDKNLKYLKVNNKSYLKLSENSTINYENIYNADSQYLIRARTRENIVYDSGTIGTDTEGNKVSSNIEEIKNNKIKEITNINLGIYKRVMPDLEAHEYMYQAIVTDKEQETDDENRWQLNKRYTTQSVLNKENYSLPIWDANNKKVITKTGNEAKKVYIVYKIALVNSQTGINNKINSVTNYYDTKYKFVSAEIADSKYNSPYKITDDKINVEEGKVTFNNLNLDVKELETKFIYVKIEIPVNIIKQQLENNKELEITKNYSEIMSYTSYEKENIVYAGVDKDSQPGNLNIEKFNQEAEDDESCSPTFWIVQENNTKAKATTFIDKLIEAKFSN